MSNRLYQVFLPYCTRASFWWMLVITLAEIGFVIFAIVQFGANERTDSVSPQLPNSPTEFSNARFFGRSTSLRRARSLSRRSISESTFEPQALSELISLEIHGVSQSAEDLRFLNTIPHLESLSVSDIQKPEDLQFLKGLKELKYLALPDSEIAGGLRHLSGMTQLRTLVICAARNQDLIFEELPKLPSLRTLVFEVPLSDDIPQTAFARLSELPLLRSVYLQNEPGDGGGFDRIRSLVPYAKIRPTEIPAFRTMGAALLMATGFIVLSGRLLQQLKTQFSHPGAKLMPNFAGSHFLMVGLLWGIPASIHFILLWQLKCGVLSSLAILFLPCGLACAALAAELGEIRTRTEAGVLLLFHMTIGLFPMSTFFAMYFLKSDFDWFLRGEQPILAVLIIVAGIAFPILAIRRLVRLPAQLHEEWTVIPSLAESISERVTRAQAEGQMWSEGHSSNTKNFPSKRLEATLAEPRPYNMPRLWIAGQEGSGTHIALLNLFLAVLFFPLLVVLRNIWLELATMGFMQDSNVVIIAWFLLDLTTMSANALWSPRRTVLGFESLHPVNRRQLVWQLFAAIAIDLTPVFLSQLFGVVLLISLYSGHLVTPAWIFAAVLCFVLKSVAVYSLVLFAMLTRGSFLLWAVISCVYLNLLFATFSLFAESSTVLNLLAPQGAALILAAVLLFCVWNYWHRAELT